MGESGPGRRGVEGAAGWEGRNRGEEGKGRRFRRGASLTADREEAKQSGSSPAEERETERVLLGFPFFLFLLPPAAAGKQDPCAEAEVGAGHGL